MIDAGYSADQVRAFFARDDVAAEMDALDREFKHAPAFEARTRYQTRRGLSQLSPGAVGLLARAMAGPKYARGPNNEILRDARGFPILQEAEVTSAQLRAAEIVVDAVGGSDGKADHIRGDVQIGVLIAAEATVTIEHDPAATTEEQKALSRERMRNAIDRLLLKLPEVRERVTRALEPPITVEAQVKKTRVVKKHPTKKKATDGSPKAD